MLHPSSAGNNQASYSSVGKSSGKWYFEVLIDAGIAGGTSAYVGIARLDVGVDTAAGTPPSSGNYLVYRTNRQVFSTGVSFLGSLGVNWAVGDIIMVALDANNGRVWVGQNGTFNGNPAAGTGQIFTLPTGQPLFAHLTAESGNAGQKMTFRSIASDQTYAAPSGFLSWA